MKRIVWFMGFFGFLIMSCVSTPQTPPQTTEYIIIIDTDKVKDDIFPLIIKWMNTYYVSSKSVIQYVNQETGTITAKARTTVGENFAGKSTMEYTLNIDIKDNKIRFAFTLINYEVYVNTYNTTRDYPLTQALYDEYFVPSAEKIISVVKKEIENADSNW